MALSSEISKKLDDIGFTLEPAYKSIQNNLKKRFSNSIREIGGLLNGGFKTMVLFWVPQKSFARLRSVAVL